MLILVEYLPQGHNSIAICNLSITATVPLHCSATSHTQEQSSANLNDFWPTIQAEELCEELLFLNTYRLQLDQNPLHHLQYTRYRGTFPLQSREYFLKQVHTIADRRNVSSLLSDCQCD